MERRFTYGKYLEEGELRQAGDISTRLDSGTLLPTIALEILREFEADEFAGRVYIAVGESWRMVTPQVAIDYVWSRDFREGKRGYFILKGSPAIWKVVDIRGEDDPEKAREYVAITLRRQGASDWWEGEIHYRDFDPESLKRWPDRDAATVAEAWVYSPERRHLGIVVLVDEFDVARGAITRERAIAEGRELRDRLVREHKGEALGLTSDRLLMYWWDGRSIG